MEDLDEAAVSACIAAGNGASLRDADALDGAVFIGDVEIVDELFSAIQRLCFEGATALLVDGAIVAYRYFSSPQEACLIAKGDSVMISTDDISGASFPRQDLIRALYACGARWLTVLDKIGRTPEANHLRPFAIAAQSALAAAGLEQ